LEDPLGFGFAVFGFFGVLAFLSVTIVLRLLDPSVVPR